MSRTTTYHTMKLWFTVPCSFYHYIMILVLWFITRTLSCFARKIIMYGDYKSHLSKLSKISPLASVKSLTFHIPPPPITRGEPILKVSIGSLEEDEVKDIVTLLHKVRILWVFKTLVTINWCWLSNQETSLHPQIQFEYVEVWHFNTWRSRTFTTTLISNCARLLPESLLHMDTGCCKQKHTWHPHVILIPRGFSGFKCRLDKKIRKPNV